MNYIVIAIILLVILLIISYFMIDKSYLLSFIKINDYNTIDFDKMHRNTDYDSAVTYHSL